MGLASGATFAGYTVVRMLSASATGETYLIQRSGLPGWQSLHVLAPEMSVDPEFRRRFLAETQIATNLYHPNIVDVYDCGDFEGQLWVATDYIDGIDAVQLMANRFPAVLAVDEVLAIVTAVGSALDHAHQRGLLHRDVKPANIVLTNPGQGELRILLRNFGIAHELGDAVQYRAPEQSGGGEIDWRADQFALAATAMHLLTGTPPIDSSHPVPVKVSELRPDLARFDGALARGCSAQPADRYGSCREFTDALHELAGTTIGKRTGDTSDTDNYLEKAPATYVVDYPTYDWPESADPPAQFAPAARPAAGPAPTPAPGPAARPIRPRRIMAGSAAAVILLAGLLVVGIMIGRKTVSTAPQAGSPATTTSPTASSVGGAAGAPAALDGTYRIEIQRSRQTFDSILSPQPPDVNTWWAIRTSCRPAGCLAAATMLNEDDHARAAQNVRPLVLEFGDGQWRSRPETVQFPCVHTNGTSSNESTTQVLSLRPQSSGDLIGEMVVTVHSDECGQEGKVIRIPAIASRDGEVPTSVIVPDPDTIPSVPKSPPTSIPSTTTATSTGPGR